MTVLVLAGTAEARRSVEVLAMDGVPVLASLAGATRQPLAMPVPTRVGGFGGEAGFRAVLRDHGIRAVLDATHPFASRITDRTAMICDQMGLPYAQILRPPWTPEAGDDWTHVARAEDVSARVPMSAVVFLATGRQTAASFRGLEGRRVLLRVIDPPRAPLPFEGGEFVIGRPPFTVASERDLFRDLGVTHLVAKNAGGQGGRAKLDAARALGLPVIMINRPAMPKAMRFERVADAVAWARSHSGIKT
ncbi:cobalt-precorrin-6A reductase [Pseudooctadecabacter jejudonensis]|uniref:Precorrin-6A reductase n=1 Tax=Pseudooctadecabacter jejudonensis TaxID=1391910 RepID=A0A1Y5RDI2_9RHOB|nr:cobalt-precorrin-6A reductase [Pseudooctadecabacter jejudonensis]SLN14594.1 Precorrin-6A reductase [Pseudooctadecabacter jejudonensis]